MKNAISFFMMILITSLFLISCNKSNEISDPILKLESPNGTTIAKSVDELRSIITPSINKKFKSAVDFKLTKISFLDVKKGAVAEIEYSTSSGINSNIVIMKECHTQFICSAKNVEGLITNENSLKSAAIITFSCSGEPCCQVHARLNPDGTINYDCSCANCAMLVEF